jgi:hypothetical protein
MYRIELAPGEETVFRTFEELATGVRNGFITSRARIYHAASQKWLPIEFHPHYKQALETPARSVQPSASKAADTARGAGSAPGLFGSSAPKLNATAPAGPPTDAPASDTSGLDASKSSAVESGQSAPDATTLEAARAASTPVDSAPAGRAPVTSEAACSEPACSEPARDAPAAFASVARSPFSEREEVIVAVLPPSAAVESAIVDAFTPESMSSQFPNMSPVLELPRISYPEITPVEEPVARRPRTLGGSRKALQLAGAAVVLVTGAYAAHSVFWSRHWDFALVSALVADRPALPVTTDPAPEPRSAEAPKRLPPKGPAAVTRPALTRLNPSQPATSGFAPALEPRALVTTPEPKAAEEGPPSSPSDSALLAPAPTAPDLIIPTLPGADSLITAPPQHTDSAMQRILRAVSGKKEIPQQH